MIMAAMVFLTIGTGYVQAQDKTSDSASELPKVYLIKEITPENLVKIYEALGRKAEGKVAVKLSTGEPGGHNFLQPTLIAPLVRKMNGTIVECNTAYGGGRANTEAHLKAAADHGFTAIAKVDIMDADGCAVAFQRSCDGWFRRRNQEYLHRHRLVGRQGVDSFGRHDQGRKQSLG